jgi:aryl-alcohol dehydrogenase-like predicted oxidoreductase
MMSSAVPRFGPGCAPLGNLFREYSDREAEAILDEIYARALQLTAVCAEHGVQLPAAASNTPDKPSVLAVVAGANTPAQLRQNLTHLETPIPQGLWHHLTSLNLVPAVHTASNQ